MQDSVKLKFCRTSVNETNEMMKVRMEIKVRVKVEEKVKAERGIR